MKAIIFNAWASGFCASAAVFNALTGNWMWVLLLAGMSLANLAVAWARWHAEVQLSEAQTAFDAQLARHRAMSDEWRD